MGLWCLWRIWIFDGVGCGGLGCLSGCDAYLGCHDDFLSRFKLNIISLILRDNNSFIGRLTWYAPESLLKTYIDEVILRN